jgi:hypothetical protein
MSIKPSLFWYTVAFLLLVHVQMNLHEFDFFVGAAVIIGLFPVKQVNWWKYALLELSSFLICLLLNAPESTTLKLIHELSGMNAVVFISATALLSTLTFVLVAQSVNLLITQSLFRRYLGV